MVNSSPKARAFPIGLKCRTCGRAVSEHESSCPDCNRVNRVTCPTCGKTVNNHFPYCELCSSPLGDEIESPPLGRHVGKRKRYEPIIGYRPASRFLKTIAVGGTFIGCACVMGWGLISLHDVVQFVAGKIMLDEVDFALTSQSADRSKPIDKPLNGGLVIPTNVLPRPTADNGDGTTWRHSREWYSNEGQTILKDVKNICAGGYLFDRTKVYAFAQKYKVFTAALNANDGDECDKMFEEARKEYRSLKSTVSWQRDVPHPKIAHVRSSQNEGCWVAEDGWEFVNPGTADLTVRRIKVEWTRPQSWYLHECEVMLKNTQNYLSGPYICNRRLGESVSRDVRNLETKVYSGEPDEVDRMYRNALVAYNQFANGCQWKSGARHPSVAHIHSGSSINTWEADEGWAFVNPGTSDLSVKRIPVMTVCPKCHGNCFYNVRIRCPVCNGRRHVPNPVAGAGRAVNVSLGIWGRRHGRRPPNIPVGPSQLPCSNCNAGGTIIQATQCERCKGMGKIYR